MIDLRLPGRGPDRRRRHGRFERGQSGCGLGASAVVSLRRAARLHRLKGHSHRFCGFESVRRRLGQRPFDDIRKRLVHGPFRQLQLRLRRCVRVFVHDGQRVPVLKGQPAGHAAIQNDTERVEVATPINPSAHALLWAHVRRCTQRRALAGQR